MDGTTIALFLLIPAVAVFGYAGWSEYRRYRSDGPSNYGLTYDPETNTTHVGPLAEGEDSYDPEDFTPEGDETGDGDAGAEDAGETGETAETDTETHDQEARQ